MELCLTKGWASKISGRYEKWGSRATCKKHLGNLELGLRSHPSHRSSPTLPHWSVVVTEADTISSGLS